MFPRSPQPFLALLALPLAIVRAADPAPETGGSDLFESKVRPLLVDRCYECHSADHKIKGGLRLDCRDGWAKGGDTGPAIEPGKPDDSLLIQAVRYQDRDLQMPPKKRLSASEVAILEQWVAAGAPDPRLSAPAVAKKQVGLSVEEGRKFWAYQAPRKQIVPAVKNEAWPLGEIDRFILAKLEEHNLSPAPDASPEILVRRLSFDLTGLPPSQEQIDAFVKSCGATDAERSAAVGALADRLLASPHFGETWGRHWLDVARFAESSGGGRTLLFKDAWRYRDYVIDSFNADRPFDQFIREQIAGDLLPSSDSEQRRRQLTATAFLVLGPTNYEEQDKQQLRFDVIDEQIDTLGKAFLGQTIGCARCHDHKFDPIPQRDYYALAGIFASTRTLFNYTDNVARWIDMPLPLDGSQETEVAATEAKLAALKKDLDAAKKQLAVLKKANTKAAITEQKGQGIAPAALPGIVVDDSDAAAIGEWKESQYSKHFIGRGYRHDLDADKGLKTLTFTPKIPSTGRYEVRLAYPAFGNRANHVPVHVFHADGEETIFIDETQEPPIDGLFVSLGTFRFEKDGAGYVLISNDGTKGYVGADAVQFLPEAEVDRAGASKELAAQKDAKDPAGKQDPIAALDAQVKALEAEQKALTAAGPHRPIAMAVQDDQKVSDTQICIRGQVHQRAAQVPRGLLQVAMLTPAQPFPADESGRLELANWLASSRNPLTARVFVNRVWQWLFGEGLVRTPDNFGTTGDAPAHPELLDYLATRFVEDGWSVKRLVGEIVTSRTWRMQVASASAHTEDAGSHAGPSDPDNRWLSHANRRRLDAEQLRDAILSVSGELNLEVGGPNIAGAGEIDANNSSAQNIEYKYEYSDTRRSVYTPAFRNKRLELFEVFDFGDINAPAGKRNVSTVAPQALYFLNHPFVLAQARKAAERALASSSSDEERLTSAFRTALGHPPSASERATMMKFISSAGDDAKRRSEAWSQIYQTLFACLDFRYLE